MRLHRILFSAPSLSPSPLHWKKAWYHRILISVNMNHPHCRPHLSLSIYHCADASRKILKTFISEKKQGLSLSCLILCNSLITAMFTRKQSFFFFKNQITATAHFFTGVSWTCLPRNDCFFNSRILKLTRRDSPLTWEVNQEWESVLVTVHCN